jgi:hypothetical protein
MLEEPMDTVTVLTLRELAHVLHTTPPLAADTRHVVQQFVREGRGLPVHLKLVLLLWSLNADQRDSIAEMILDSIGEQAASEKEGHTAHPT